MYNEESCEGGGKGFDINFPRNVVTDFQLMCNYCGRI